MTQDAHPITIQFFTSCAAFIVIAPILYTMRNSTIPELHLIIINDYQLFLLLGVGIAATIAHMFLTFAFRLAAVSILAPLQYLEIVAATIFGLLIFDDFPDKITILGITIIIGSGLFVLMRERKLELDRQAKQTLY
jgi:drug/metabolite transporter (DMT)-like permease